MIIIFIIIIIKWKIFINDKKTYFQFKIFFYIHDQNIPEQKLIPVILEWPPVRKCKTRHIKKAKIWTPIWLFIFVVCYYLNTEQQLKEMGLCRNVSFMNIRSSFSVCLHSFIHLSAFSFIRNLPISNKIHLNKAVNGVFFWESEFLGLYVECFSKSEYLHL